MKTTNKIAIAMIIVTIIAFAAPASAYFTTQTIETKAERIVDIAAEAQERVTDIVAAVEANATAMLQITDAELTDEFYGNLSLCVQAGTMVNGEAASADGEGWTYLNEAQLALQAGEYEEAIEYAREALEIFRDALRSIHVILCEADVEFGQILDPQILQEAIDRSQDRITELRALLKDTELLDKLDDAEDWLTDAQDQLDLEEIEAAKESLREANALISEVCQDLKQIAQELNPGRIKGYLDEAYQYRERFRERFGNAWNEEIDVDKFLQAAGYQNEEEFMTQFQEMINKAQDSENIDEAIQNLQDIGQMIQKMDSDLTQEFGRHRGGQGQDMPGKGNGFGNMGGGNSP
ncbi:MAG: hypothetical protein CW716_02250 [Candidatus Bathyarchaeum sp.]|nr:MAG: hypothetical protein CW716_02250 [Candidatus Bathyarchaeum sp.]